MCFSILLMGFNTYAALNATTANVIQGTRPYFKIGGERVTDLNKLLDITVGSGDSAKTYDVTYSDPAGIDFPVNGGLGDVTAKVVTSNIPVLLSTLFTESTSRGDDDGDGGAINDKYTITGKLVATWRGWKDNSSTVIDNLGISTNACLSGYDYFTLSVTTNPSGGDEKPKIATTFGYPLDQEYEHVSKDYKFNLLPDICAVKPGDLTVPGSPTLFPPMWDNTAKVFMPQSDYTKNFPTTAANKLFFNLIVKGIDVNKLVWKPSVTGTPGSVKITASTYSDNTTNVNVRFAGPVATTLVENNKFGVSEFTISAKKSLETEDVVMQYKFKVQKWFINSGAVIRSKSGQETWCNSLVNYQLAGVADLTTASGKTAGDPIGSLGLGNVLAVPYPNKNTAPNNNMFWRYIGGGLLSEWGNVSKYEGSGFLGTGADLYWLLNGDTNKKPVVTRTSDGIVIGSSTPNLDYLAICVSKAN